MQNHSITNYTKIVEPAVGLCIVTSLSVWFTIINVPDSNPSLFLLFIMISVAVLYTARLFKNGNIVNPDCFINFLSIKVFFSTLIYVLLWYKPLAAIGHLTFATQDEAGFQDSMFYQFHAAIVSQLDFSEWLSASNVTWQSEGVVCYIAIINRLFGLDLYNVVIVNILLSYLGILQLCKIGDIGLLAKSHYLLVWPHTLYYDVPPGKEALTNFFLFYTIAVASKLFVGSSRFKVNQLAKIIIGLSFLSLIRVNVAILLILSIFFSVVVTRKKFVQPALILILAALLVYLAFGGLLSVYLDSTFVNAGNASGSDGVQGGATKIQIATFLHWLSSFVGPFLSPVYAIVWLLSPLPNIGLDRMYSAFIDGDSYAQFTFGPYFFRVLSSIWIAKIVSNRRTWKYVGDRLKNCVDYKFLFIIASMFTLLIAYSNLVEGARYRVVVEPMIFVLCGSITNRSRGFGEKLANLKSASI